MLAATKQREVLDAFKAQISARFRMTDCGPVHQFLGMRITRDFDKRLVSLDQQAYAHSILERFNMLDCRPASTPSDLNARLIALPATSCAPSGETVTAHPAELQCNNAVRNNAVSTDAQSALQLDRSTENYKQLVPANKSIYQQLVGSLMHLMIGTRPDIANAVNIVSRFAANPSEAHMEAAKRILRYIKGTVDFKLHLQAAGTDSDLPLLTGYSDADWGGDLVERKSTSGYVFRLGNAAISWQSKRQPTVALSSTESEYMALTLASKEAVWLRTFLLELGLAQDGATPIYEDNQGCIALARNASVHHARTKHIDIQHHFVRELVEAGTIVLHYLETHDMVADVFTKPLPVNTFRKFRDALNIVS
jgi:hypothetical protein